MMQVTGEEGVTLADYVTYQKSLFLDMVYLQQDAYDKVDLSVPLDRQKETFALVRGLIRRDYAFGDKEEAHRFFTNSPACSRTLTTRPETPLNIPRTHLGQIEERVKTLGRSSALAPEAKVASNVSTSSSLLRQITERAAAQV